MRRSTAQQTKYYFIASVNPVEMFLLAQGPHGQLSCYTINLIDFFDSTRFASQLYLRYSWLGHQSSIIDIKRYQHSNYLLTKSVDDSISIWRYEKPKVICTLCTFISLGSFLIPMFDSLAQEQCMVSENETSTRPLESARL